MKYKANSNKYMNYITHPYDIVRPCNNKTTGIYDHQEKVMAKMNIEL